MSKLREREDFFSDIITNSITWKCIGACFIISIFFKGSNFFMNVGMGIVLSILIKVLAAIILTIHVAIFGTSTEIK